jgi:hypothetical protein
MRISEAQRWQIIDMHTTGMSFKAIGRQMGYHYDSPWLNSRWFQTVSNCSCWQTSIGQPVLFEYGTGCEWHPSNQTLQCPVVTIRCYPWSAGSWQVFHIVGLCVFSHQSADYSIVVAHLTSNSFEGHPCCMHADYLPSLCFWYSPSYHAYWEWINFLKQDLPRSGRPRVTSDCDNRALERLVRRMPFATSPVLKQHWLPNRRLYVPWGIGCIFVSSNPRPAVGYMKQKPALVWPMDLAPCP